MQLDGSAQHTMADASGASHLKLADFQINDADIALSGASDATINAAGTLDIDLSGASSLRYRGQPSLGRLDISGGSTIKRD